MVAVGLTLVEPLADDEVNVPGVIETLVAPLVAQLNVLLAPALMLAGFAVNELIVGLLNVLPTVTVTVAVLAPAAFVAVNVKVVVAVGLTIVDPLAVVELNVPGVIVMVVAPLVAHAKVALDPAAIVAGFAENAEMAGTWPFLLFWFEVPLRPAQPAKPRQVMSNRAGGERREISLEAWREKKCK